MQLYFNTSRQYARDGQLIYATLEGDVIQFDDYSRMISGRVDTTIADVVRDTYSPDAFARLVMQHYDNHHYTWAPTRERPDLEPVVMRL